jgi:hypothetical protein
VKVEKILQIIPADGWSAVFALRNHDTDDVNLHEEPLVCWALFEKNGMQDMSGLTREGATFACVEDPDFIGYLARGESASKYAEEGRAHLRRRELRENKKARLRAAGYRDETKAGTLRWLSPRDGRWLSTKEAFEQMESFEPLENITR